MKHTLKHKFALFYVLITSLCFAALGLNAVHSLGYRVDVTGSMPGRVYRIAPLGEDEKISAGDCVLIDISRFSSPVITLGMERGYLRKTWNYPMLKRIGAVPGDTVELRNGFMFVNGSASRMAVASEDLSGRKLTAYPTPVTIQPGWYWLASDAEIGFDSRYFGPVTRGAITHKAEIVF